MRESLKPQRAEIKQVEKEIAKLEAKKAKADQKAAEEAKKAEAEHNKLMKCIEEKGLLISEYPPGTHPDRYRFPRRNRLISSWSDKLFVIQAEKGSGALITAEYSRKYGREVEME